LKNQCLLNRPLLNFLISTKSTPLFMFLHST
jgi:hypothetical protein